MRDLKEQGHQVLLRTRSTSRWWLSKCIWCFSQTIAYFGLLFLICAVFCFTAGGKLQLDPNPEVVASIIKGKLTFSPAAFRIHVLLMPFLVSVALCLLQQTVALFTGEGVSFVIICSWLFLSIYRPDALMIGNYTMLLRSRELYPAGVRFQTGIVLSLAVAVLSIVVGALKLKNMDVGRQ